MPAPAGALLRKPAGSGQNIGGARIGLPDNPPFRQAMTCLVAC
jgi:hypothetical protein